MKKLNKVLTNNHIEYFKEELEKTNRLKIVSPFISDEVTQYILRSIKGENIKLLTRYNPYDFYLGVSSLYAMKDFYYSNTQVRGVYRLHSKLYIFDNRSAIITSANFTMGGMINNMELGILLNNTSEVKDCLRYFGNLWKKSNNPLNKQMINGWENKLKKYQQDNRTNEILKGLGDEGKNCFDKKGKEKIFLKSKKAGFKKESKNKTFYSNKRFFIKYIGATDARVPINTKIKDVVDDAECHKYVFYSYHPRQISDGDIVYLARMTENPYDYAIIGRADGYKHKGKFDVATPREKQIKKWKNKYQYYNRMKNPEIQNGTLDHCVLLRNNLIDEFDYKSLASTLRRYKNGERNINVITPLMQKQFVEITPIAAKWLDVQLENNFKNYGKISKQYLNKI